MHFLGVQMKNCYNIACCCLFMACLTGCNSGPAINRLVSYPGYGFAYLPEGIGWERPLLAYNQETDVKKLDDAGLLKCLPDLLLADPYSLSLEDAPITDESVRLIVQLKSLEQISIRGTLITKKGVEQLAEMHHLHSIFVSRNCLSSEDASSIMSKSPRKDLIISRRDIQK